MASKGPKIGVGKPVVAAPAVPMAVRKPKAAPQPKIAAPTIEPLPVPAPEAVAPVAAPVPPVVPFVEAAPQVEKIEAAIEAAVAGITPEVAKAADAAQAVVTETETQADAAFEATAEPIKKEVNTMVEAIENTIAKSQTLFTDMNERAKAAAEKNAKLVEDFSDFAKGNVEAIVESSKITAKGFETLGQEAADYSRKSFESATAALRGMASVKSPTDFFKMQSDFVRGMFDSVVAEASKNTETVLKLAGDAAQPLSNRWAVAADKIKSAA